MLKIKKIIFILPVFLILFLAYRSFFLNSPLVWGDAPYFYENAFIDNFGEPSSWVSRANNFGGPQSLFWISPIMFVYSILGLFLKLDNDLIVRLLFYFPGLFFSIIGSYLLAKRFKLNFLSSILCTFIYTINTYSILLVDGGQVGVYLAYGLAPFVFLTFINFQIYFTKQKFIKFLLVIFLCSIADFRIAFLVLFFSFLFYSLWKRKIAFKALFSTIILIPLFSYFLYPAISGMYESFLPVQLNSRFFSLLNGLTFYQPHWPLNQYGLITYPSFLFAFVFVFIILGVFLKPSRKLISLGLIFLASVFLLKGETEPFGFVNIFLTSKIFFGFIFRDSSKFFVITAMTTSLLVSYTYNLISIRFVKIKPYIFYTFILFFSFLVFPVFSNTLNGTLMISRGNNLKNVYQYLNQENFSRALWMPYFHPFTYQTENNQGISGRDLINLPIFKLMNKGGDAFNFMYNFDFLDWFRFLGINNVIFSGVVKNIPLDINDKIDQVKMNARFVSLGMASKSIDNINIYKIDFPEKRIVGFDKVFLVIGEPYQINLPNQFPQLFFEDGIFKPFDPDEISADTVEVIFNNADDNDLVSSLLQKDFIDTNKIVKNSWAIGDNANYLKWKYELLIRGFDLRNMVYNKNIFYSSKQGEKIIINITNKYIVGDYYIGFRTFSNGNPLKIKFGDKFLSTNKNDIKQFNWTITKIKIDENIKELEIENDSDFSVLNTIFIAPEKNYNQAVETSKKYVSKFKTYRISDLDKDKIKVLPANNYNLDYKSDRPWRHFVSDNSNVNWVLLKDTYDKLWNLKNNDQLVGNSYPLFSFLNLFYVKPNWKQISIEYLGQDYFRIGLVITFVSILVLIVVILMMYEIESDKRNNKK